jgi:hypothetical protein
MSLPSRTRLGSLAPFLHTFENVRASPATEWLCRRGTGGVMSGAGLRRSSVGNADVSKMGWLIKSPPLKRSDEKSRKHWRRRWMVLKVRCCCMACTQHTHTHTRTSHPHTIKHWHTHTHCDTPAPSIFRDHVLSSTGHAVSARAGSGAGCGSAEWVCESVGRHT